MQGWTTRQAYEMIVKESGVEYHRKHIYKVLHRWGFKEKVPRKVHVNTASDEEKEAFKKSEGNLGQPEGRVYSSISGRVFLHF
jgi:transposase